MDSAGQEVILPGTTFPAVAPLEMWLVLSSTRLFAAGLLLVAVAAANPTVTTPQGTFIGTVSARYISPLHHAAIIHSAC